MQPSQVWESELQSVWLKEDTGLMTSTTYLSSTGPSYWRFGHLHRPLAYSLNFYYGNFDPLPFLLFCEVLMANSVLLGDMSTLDSSVFMCRWICPWLRNKPCLRAVSFHWFLAFFHCGRKRYLIWLQFLEDLSRFVLWPVIWSTFGSFLCAVWGCMPSSFEQSVLRCCLPRCLIDDVFFAESGVWKLYCYCLLISGLHIWIFEDSSHLFPR